MATSKETTDHGDYTAVGRDSPIEADSSPNNSVIDNGLAESTASLNTSLLNYPLENGRRYHKFREGTYLYPNDEAEKERLDYQYEIFKMLFGGKVYFAPVHNPKKVLDIGTGTGIWAIDMAELFPDCEVIGTDLSAIQPDWVPDNVRFFVDDASEEDWLYPPNTFDHIHTRIMFGCFEDFRDIIRKGVKYAKPGGWMECQEIFVTPACDDDSMSPDFPLLEWAKTVDDASMEFGRPLRIANKLKRWFVEAGFEDVHEQVFKLPINAWPKDPRLKQLGQMNELNMLEGVQSWSLASMYRVLGWTQSEIEVYLVNVRNAIKNRSVHAYYKIYVVWGRKPMGDAPAAEPAT